MSPEEIATAEKVLAAPLAGDNLEKVTAGRPAPGETVNAPASSRIVSLDVFRGMTIAGMILVNNSGGPSYGPLDHAEWNGWTHTDLIFPFFMFIAGASMALSFARRMEKSLTARVTEGAKGKSVKASWLWHTLRRGATIFFIGLFLNLYPWFFDTHRYATLRIPGVLQRIGFCYVFAGMIYLFASKRTRVGIIVTALLAYWAAMKLIPVPGVGAGDLSPNNNLAAYIDNSIFGVQHMWQHRPWDPEGLLSSAPALCTMLIGTFVGELFVSNGQLSAISHQQEQVPPLLQAQGRNDNGAESFVQNKHSVIQSTWIYKVTRLIAWGIAFVAVGKLWNVWFPINKNLWTSSYVMFTAGYAMLVLAACYWIVDVKGIRKWATPFLVFGSNAILVFTLSTWMTKILLITRVANGEGGTESAWSWVILNSWRSHFADVRNSSLAFALSYVLIWLAVMWWFWRKKIFVKI